MAGFTLLGPTHTLLTTSMRLRAARNEVLAANIANVDTPGYHSRDLKFAGVLQALAESGESSTGGQNGRIQLVSTHPGHLRPGMQNALRVEEDEGEKKLDHNQVDLEQEMTRFAENSLLHETSVTLLSRSFGSLRYAINEGRG